MDCAMSCEDWEANYFLKPLGSYVHRCTDNKYDYLSFILTDFSIIATLFLILGMCSIGEVLSKHNIKINKIN